MKTLLVLGATGQLGRRIVALARRLLPDVRVLQGARRVATETDPDLRRVDIHDADSVRRALAGVQVVINAVGPFEYDPTPLLEGCAEAACHYIDIAETPQFLAQVERLASRLPIATVSGCSTLPGLVQALARRWSGRDEVRRVRILLGMGTRNPVTPTLLYSLLSPLGSHAPDGARYFGRLVRKPLRGLRPRYYGRFPSPFEVDGLRIGERMLPATFHAGLDRAAAVHVLWLAARVVPHLRSEALSWLCRMAQPVMPLIQALGTPVGVLSIEALTKVGRLVAEVEVRALKEALNIPSLPAVWAARRLLGENPPSGPLGLENLVTPQEAVDWLRAEGYQVTSVDTPG
jgi:Saccharopine dehydrogenase NADP binding domain